MVLGPLLCAYALHNIVSACDTYITTWNLLEEPVDNMLPNLLTSHLVSLLKKSQDF